VPRISRPALIIVEPNPGEALSVRKLAVETAKYNVLTAHSAEEGMELVDLFPKADGIIVHGKLPDREHVERHAKKDGVRLPLIFLQTHTGEYSAYADHTVSSHAPGELIDLLRSLFGDPRSNPSSAA
jgi:hypothetical protein